MRHAVENIYLSIVLIDFACVAFMGIKFYGRKLYSQVDNRVTFATTALRASETAI